MPPDDRVEDVEGVYILQGGQVKPVVAVGSNRDGRSSARYGTIYRTARRD